jgi:putative FmdB family regulatory protein
MEGVSSRRGGVLRHALSASNVVMGRSPMPVYEYACTECGARLEVRQSFTDDALTTCPECTGRLRKLLSPVGVVFKGSGFYRTDSRTPPASDGSADGKAKTPADGSGSNGSGSSGSESSGDSAPAKKPAKEGAASAPASSSAASSSASTPSGTSSNGGSKAAR